MWTRKELKDKAKVSFKANYWKSVFMALVLVVAIGGLSVVSMARVPAATAPSTVAVSSYEPGNVNVEIKDGKVKIDVDDNGGGKVHVDMDADDVEDLGKVLDKVGIDSRERSHAAAVAGPALVFAGLSVFLVVLLATAIAVAVYVFVVSPLEVGAQRFFVRNLNQRAEVKEMAYGYDNNYKEVVKTLFMRDLFIFLWALLLVIPGIYKAYQYRMIPYLLADDPTMTKDRAFAESKRMMDGQKWNAFVLDLSFLGWNILSALTLGILGAFYVTPYQTQTNAALYEKLRYGLPAPDPMQQGYGQPAQQGPVAPVAPMGSAPMVNTQVVGAPVIVPDSQPPVPPFAQVGVQPQAAPAATATMPAAEAAPAEDAPTAEAGPEAAAPIAEVSPETEAATADAATDATAPLAEAAPEAAQATAEIAASAAATTAPIPEPGIEATAEMPGVSDSADGDDANATAEGDSTEA